MGFSLAVFIFSACRHAEFKQDFKRRMSLEAIGALT
jgi:hypothetical protein